MRPCSPPQLWVVGTSEPETLSFEFEERENVERKQIIEDKSTARMDSEIPGMQQRH